MNFLHMNLGILDGVFAWMLDLVNQVFAAVFACFINLFNLVFGAAMFTIASILGALADFFQGVFRSLAGIGVIYDSAGNGIENQDPIFTMITSDVVWKTFLIMIAIAFVLVILMAIVAIIRNEYNTDKANNTKGGVLGAAVKSIAFFAITPVVTILGVLGCNTLLRVLDTATGGQDTSISGQVFAASAYGANYIRIGNEMKSIEDMDWSNGNEFAGNVMGTISQALISGMNHIFAVYTANMDHGFYSLSGTLYDNNSWTDEQKAKAVDEAFANSKLIDTGDYAALKGRGAINGLTSILFNTGMTTVVSQLVGSGVKPELLNGKRVLHWTDAQVVSMYYQLSGINYIVLIGGMMMVLYVMYTAAFGLMIRLYKCTMLFIVSPPVIALGPMDNMSAFGNWRKQFVGQALGAYGVVIGMNLAFKLINVTNNINLFDPRSVAGYSGNLIVHAMLSIAALYMMKDFIKMVSGFVGGDDVSAGGADLAKKVTKTGLAVGAVALGGGAIVAKGVGMAAGAVGKGSFGSLTAKYTDADGSKIKVGFKQRVGSLFKGQAADFERDENGNIIKDNSGHAKIKDRVKHGFSNRFKESWDKHNITRVHDKGILMNMIGTGIGALKGGMDGLGFGQFTKWLGGNVGKQFTTMQNNNASAEGALVQKENMMKAYDDVKLNLANNRSIIEDSGNEVRLQTLKEHAERGAFDNEKDKKAMKVFDEQLEGVGLEGLTVKELKSMSVDDLSNLQAQKLKDAENQAFKTAFGLNDGQLAALDQDPASRNKMLSQLDEMFEKVTTKQFGEIAASGMEANGKGGLKVLGENISNALSAAIGKDASKLDDETIKKIGNSIAAAISGEADKVSKKIHDSLKGEDLQNAQMQQLLNEMKGMREDLKKDRKD